MATIETRKRATGTTYRVKVRLRGYPPADATFTRKTDAKQWAAETETAIRAGRWFQHVEAKRNTLADLIDRYTKDYLPHSGIKHPDKRVQHLAVWRDMLGAHSLADITPAKIVEARSRLLATITYRHKPMMPATANRYLASLRHCLNIGVREFQLLDDAPTRKVRQLAEPRGRVRFLSDDERDALLISCKLFDETLHAIVVIAVSTGARRGEILGLRWSEVDLQTGKLIFLDTKNGDRRSAPLTGFALECLRQHAKVRRLDSDLVFPGRARADGNVRPLNLENAFRQTCAVAGLRDFHFHDLRHTAASWLAMNGASLSEIAEVLGHKTLAMVKRYSHMTEGHTRGVVERMNRKMLGGQS